MMGSGIMAANTVLLTMLTGHSADLSEVGVFTLALTTAQVLYSIGLLGANDLQMTDYNRRYAFSQYFWAKVISTILAVLAGILVVQAFGFDERARLYTLLLTGFMLVNSFAELYQSLYFQNQRLDLSGKSLFFRYLLSTIAFALGIFTGKTIIISCVLMLAADIAATIYWIIRYEAGFRDSDYHLNLQRTIRLIREVLPLGVSVLASLLLVNAPKYLIYLFVSDATQGIYTLLFMPVYAVNLLSQFIFKPFLYRYAEFLQGDQDGFGSLFVRQALVICGAAVSGALFFWLFGVPFMRVFFGQDLAPYRNLMFLFMLSGGFLAINQLLYYLLVILNKQKTILYNYVVSALWTVPIGIILVPRFTILGAWVCFTVGQASLTAGYAGTLLHSLSLKREKQECSEGRYEGE